MNFKSLPSYVDTGPKGRRGRRDDEEEDDDMPSQPSAPTTLFDFLESKLGPSKAEGKCSMKILLKAFINKTSTDS